MYLESGHPSDTHDIRHGDECIVTGSFVDMCGDLMYTIEGFGNVGWEAEAFTQTHDEEIAEIINELTNH